MVRPPSTLIIACGALARELVSVIRANRLPGVAVTCLPAHLHNRPSRIPEEVRRKIRQNRGRYDEIRVLYGDCGTGGRLDAVLEEEGVERIPGAHCYEFYLGTTDFEALAEAEPGAFFLTDYLVRHFDRLIIKGLGLDRFPQLRDDYFRHYDKVIYLAQMRDPDLARQAATAAERLGLKLELRYTGLAGLTDFVVDKAGASEHVDKARHHRLLA
jgi:hypothetical protein